MKKLLVTRYMLCSVLFLGLSKVSYSQTETQVKYEVEQRSDEDYKMSNLSGVGTKTIIYTPGVEITEEIASAVLARLQGTEGVVSVSFDRKSGSFKTVFFGITTHRYVSFIYGPIQYNYFSKEKMSLNK